MDRRAALKDEYKNRPIERGIYQIKNQINGKILIGSSRNLHGTKSRFEFEQLHGGIAQGWFSKDLQQEWREFGAEQFGFEVLDQLEPRADPNYNYTEDLKTLEELWLEKLQPYQERGYNVKKNVKG